MWDENDRKQIEKIAYHKWLLAGKPSGRDLEFWAGAEREYSPIVYLVYEDDYGGLFSPFVLTAIYPQQQYERAIEYLNTKIGVIITTCNVGFDHSAYSYYYGGKW